MKHAPSPKVLSNFKCTEKPLKASRGETKRVFSGIEKRSRQDLFAFNPHHLKCLSLKINQCQSYNLWKNHSSADLVVCDPPLLLHNVYCTMFMITKILKRLPQDLVVYDPALR